MENNATDNRFTVMIYTENQTGLLQQFSNVFTRHSLDIWSVSASPSSLPGIHKLTIEVKGPEDRVALTVKQLERKIEVIKAFYYTDDELVYRELALYKVETGKLLEFDDFENFISSHNARILEMNTTFTVIQKTGNSEETGRLYDELSPFGVLQFVRSGRVAVTKSRQELVTGFLKKREEERSKQSINK
ncbi:MAG: acetolactate synthase small subunit [Bacteroidales bacterium]|jgi:acetolactate synthase-1/3 small subunit|nr:acetolactate synthase small subunit [Bacteroidales bacterium]